MPEGGDRGHRPPGGASLTDEQARRRTFRRRRGFALAGLASAVALISWAAVSFWGDDGTRTVAAAPKQLARGGRVVLPHYRVVSFYGAPQDEQLGALGIGRPRQVAHKLLRQAKPYASPRRPVMPAFELIVTIAQAAPGPDGKHRLRQRAGVIQRYLKAVRRIKGLLILDIQPGQSDFLEEVRALEPYLKQPDVGLALDSEWSVPSGTVPGRVIGSTDAETVNRVSAYLSGIVLRGDLPQKLLLVHQFTDGMVQKKRLVAARRGLAIVFNIDGFGTQELKIAVYKRLALRRRPRRAGLFNGLKLFFHEDTQLLSPGRTLGLHPRPDVVVYE